MGVSPQAVPPFLANLDMVLTRVTMNQLEIWFQRGLDVLKENPDGGIAYFKVESSTSENLLESLVLFNGAGAGQAGYQAVLLRPVRVRP